MQRKTISTNSGMWILWDYSAYNNINDYGDWADIFEEEIDIIEQIKQRKIVPININSDGVFDFEVKLNEKLDDREKKYVLVSSSDYVINSMGKLVLSGIEFIDGDIKETRCIIIETEKGYLKVKVNLIDWKKEPNSLDENNKPSAGALPDFIIELNSVGNSLLNDKFSNSIKTF